jgi:hypothetical protein
MTPTTTGATTYDFMSVVQNVEFISATKKHLIMDNGSC